MTKKEILKRLVKLASMPGSHSSPFCCTDLVTQDNLYSVQADLLKLVGALADNVPGGSEFIVRELPYAFRMEPVPG